MDDFKLELERRGDQILVIEARAVLNGEQLPEVFSICNMLPAIERNGRHPLFTCTCGIFGCGGYWVDIECTKDAWVWRNGYNPADEDEPEEQWLMYEFEYRIPWPQVQTAIEKIRDAILEFRENRPHDGVISLRCAKAILDYGQP